MDIPSPARIMVELQKSVTRGHRLLLQSPLAPLVSTTSRATSLPSRSATASMRPGASMRPMASTAATARRAAPCRATPRSTSIALGSFALPSASMAATPRLSSSNFFTTSSKCVTPMA
jgi:hypothetical protein